jgi:hypothetical protein
MYMRDNKKVQTSFKMLQNNFIVEKRDKKMRTEINKAKATFTGRSPRYYPATIEGHLEDIEPKTGGREH